MWHKFSMFTVEMIMSCITGKNTSTFFGYVFFSKVFQSFRAIRRPMCNEIKLVYGWADTNKRESCGDTVGVCWWQGWTGGCSCSHVTSIYFPCFIFFFLTESIFCFMSVCLYHSLSLSLSLIFFPFRVCGLMLLTYQIYKRPLFSIKSTIY